LVFSIKDYLLEQEKSEIKKYMENEENYSSTFSELLSDKIKNKLNDIK
jgi:hypothetical protein